MVTSLQMALLLAALSCKAASSFFTCSSRRAAVTHTTTRRRRVVANSRDEVEVEDAHATTSTTLPPPWSISNNQRRTPNSKAYARFRQHVNPLSRRFQMPTDLPDNWPHCDFDNVNLPLYLDIGCGKGGFLLELVGRRLRRHHHCDANNSHNNSSEHDYFYATDSYTNNTKLFRDTTDEWLPSTMNYLGLEIRPGVSQYAQGRVRKRGLSGKLSFVGCNANVDLDRLLSLYNEAAFMLNDDEEEDEGSVDADSDSSSSISAAGENNELKFVSIQFPDPHFKKSHNKRRVVTPALVTTLAKYMNEGGVVFLQSDVKEALEAMRDRFVEDDGLVYFQEHGGGDDKEYGLANILGVPTEREVSVLNNDLPIYRTLFTRNDISYRSKSS